MAVIEEALYTRLSGFAGLTAIVSVTGQIGTGIYANMAPQGAKYPHVTYQRIATPRERVMGGTTTFLHPTFQITAWGRNYSDISNVADQLISALDNYSATVSGVQIEVSWAQNMTDLPVDFEGNIHARAVDFEVWHR